MAARAPQWQFTLEKSFAILIRKAEVELAVPLRTFLRPTRPTASVGKGLCLQPNQS